jgi:outer membrane protein
MLVRVRIGRFLLWKPFDQTKEIIMKRFLLVGSTAVLGLALAVPAFAHEAGDWIVRGGIGTVMPKSNNLVLPFIEIGDVSIDARVKVDDGTSLTLSGTYMFKENWAFVILAAWPFIHDVDLDATVSDGVDTFSGVVPFGEVEHLPPTFSVQYHFSPDAKFQPFVGLGLNYTTFLSEDLTQDVIDAGIVDFSLDDSFGVAAQLGADWMLNDRSLINFDIRWISIESDLSATIDDGVSSPTTGELGTVKIDPWVFAINYGYKF